MLALDMQNLSLDMVIKLMSVFPCLEKLYIKSVKSGPVNSWRQRRNQRNLIRDLEIRLKTLVLEKYKGSRSQVNFLTFFVLNAKVLESMTLGIKDEHNNKEFLEEQRRKLEVEKRVSRAALFHFTNGPCVRSTNDVRHVRDLDLTDPFAHRTS